MKNNQFYILLLGTTLASVGILLNYYQQKKKKKQDEERKNEYLKCISLFDFEELAKKLMMPHRFYYYNYKSGQGDTYQACRDYFDKQSKIVPRALIDVTQISLKTTIFGSTYESPVIIAPSAFHCLAHVDGEVGTARGATEAQCIYTYNWMLSNMPEEKILETTGPKFLHIYLTIPIEIFEKIVLKAEENGYRAIVITCDHPTNRVREHIISLFEEVSTTVDPDLQNSISLSNMNLSDVTVMEKSRTGSLTWTNIEWIRKLTKLPIICKGILSPIDVELAIKYRADGIVVSNHGGRQVDTAPPAIEFLKDIVEIVNGRVEVFIDTGIRTGTDVLKALALGARAVFIGRPILYGLACGGITSIDQINNEILYKHVQ